MLAHQKAQEMSMELMEIGRTKVNRPCHEKGRIGFKVKNRVLVGRRDKPMNRLQDLIREETIQKLGRRAEQLSQRVEQNPILKNLSPTRHMV